MRAILLTALVLFLAWQPVRGTELAPLPKTPTLNVSASQNSFVLDAEEQMLPWHEWHHRVGKALGRHVKKAAGGGLGSVVLRVTVYKDHHLVVDMVNSSTDRFGQICLDGARSLDADPMLAFPADSKRDVILFNFQYKKGLFCLPRDEYIKDDFERLNKD